MKRYIYYIVALTGISLLSTSCNDSFLNRIPTDDLNDKGYWNTANDLEVYNNGIYNEAANNGTYEFLSGYGTGGYASSYQASLWKDVVSDNFASKSYTDHAGMTKRAAGLETIPTGVSTGGWQWGLLRRINVFFANYGKANEPVSIKNQYAGEAYFFRAWFYLDKVQKYGDVPWIGKPLTTSSEEVYGPRDSRLTVMDSVLVDIDKACKYLPTTWTGKECRVNQGAALALKSRICLYEGTYRKYHKLSSDYDKWLKEAVNAAEECMKLGYSISSDYAALFNSEDLSSNKEIIFYQKYAAGLMGHRLSGYIVANDGCGATKDFVEDFLCLEPDGKAVPMALSTSYNDDTYENELKNRDPRLTYTILDPKKSKDILYSMNQYSFPRVAGMTKMESSTGYHVIKYYSAVQDAKGQNNETSDAPIFRYAEILLNLAEAKAELGTLTQTDLDKTINVLRNRVNMPHLTLNPVMDPKYAGEGLSALLVEVRRERRIELSFENTRYQDLMRWKQGKRLVQRVLGMRFEPSYFDDPHYNPTEGKANPKLVLLYEDPKSHKHYIDVFKNTDYEKRVFDEEKHYLRPIPTDVISMNPKIGQNPNWN